MHPIKLRVATLAVVLVFVAAGPGDAKPTQDVKSSSALRDYVSRPDASYAWKVRRRGALGTGEFAELTLTSQTWHDIVWKHQLFIYRPAKLKNSSQALLLIDGGSWNDSLEAPSNENEPLPDRTKLFAALADVIGSPVAIVRQVPQQPIFDGRKEDQIIALTFSKFLETGESDWPLLLPMVKSAVRAMDAVQKFAHDEWQTDVTHFTVTGASKRGWTTWLTAATDPRVNALAPMVINMLNMEAHDQLQKESFGGYSEQIRDYTERGLHEKLFTERGAELRSIVDPYAYRQRILQPKLIILGTNDAYWPVDSLNLYWNDLAGDKYILYVPNNGHGIRDYGRVVAAVAALQRSVAGGKPLPKLDWHIGESANGVQLDLTTDTAPNSVRQWTATSDSRDFRQAEWTSKELTAMSGNGDQANTFAAQLARPARGYNAMFLEAEFPGETVPFDLSTTLHVFSARPEPKAADASAAD